MKKNKKQIEARIQTKQTKTIKITRNLNQQIKKRKNKGRKKERKRRKT